MQSAVYLLLHLFCLYLSVSYPCKEMSSVLKTEHIITYRVCQPEGAQFPQVVTQIAQEVIWFDVIVQEIH